jgi:peptidoglycan/LPS O-acetylase OafA/YrhL
MDASVKPLSRYRADIDGLRAIAVLAVLLTHLGIGWMGGGYVGVDMFFVISGYVVFGDLSRRAEAGPVSPVAFYVRRARRLLPNLAAMSLAVLAVAAIVFLPSDHARLPLRIAASLIGFANWLFAHQSGYFMPASEWNPLLHTWTLSVELQFYLVVPVLVAAAARHGTRALQAAVIALTAGSLGYCLLTSDVQSGWHFYDTGARAWEFMLGVGAHMLRFSRARPTIASAVCGGALAVLLGCFVLLDRDGAFPDGRALLPTLATCALIVFLPNTGAIRRLLSSPAIVTTGKASYSIYIWHWPFIVFTTYLWPGLAEGPQLALVLLPPILAVSFIMWRHLEVPMRDPVRFPPRKFWRAMGAAGVILAVFAVPVATSRGWPGRLDERIRRLDNDQAYISARRKECHRDDLSRPLAFSCRYGANVAPRIAIWSDSHGVELADNLAAGLAAHGEAAVLFSFSSCPPRQPARLRTICDKFDRMVLQHLLAEPTIETVVLAGALDDQPYDSATAWPIEFTAAARALLSAGKRLVIVYPVPRQAFHVPRAMANSLRFGIDYNAARTDRAQYLARTRRVFATYDALGTRGVEHIYPDRTLCASGPCSVAADGQPLYFDDNHLSMRGARELAAQTLLTLN